MMNPSLAPAPPAVNPTAPAASATLSVHPVALLFPPMPADAYAALVEDIRTYSQRSPITVFRGAIVDGVHRARACQELGIVPATQEFTGAEAELLAYVVSMNLTRRHLDETQRAMVAEKIATRGSGGDQRTPPIGEVSRAEAAKLLKVGTSSIDRARVVRHQGVPELVEAVERGQMSLARAVEIAKQPKEGQRKQIQEHRHRKRGLSRRHTSRVMLDRVDRALATMETMVRDVLAHAMDDLGQDRRQASWARRLREMRTLVSRFISRCEGGVDVKDRTRSQLARSLPAGTS